MSEPDPLPIDEVVTRDQLHHFARRFGLEYSVTTRCSDLFLAETYGMAKCAGINPGVVIDEVNALEGFAERQRGTKKSDAFRHPRLWGLRKKHFFAAGFIRENLRLAWAHGRLDQMVKEELDPDRNPPGETRQEFATRVSHAVARRVIEGAFLARQKSNKLTGEWIVYAPHPTGNHYLAIGLHGDDAAIREKIVRFCVPQFPFLREVLRLDVQL